MFIKNEIRDQQGHKRDHVHQKMKFVINKDTNATMSRYHLFQEMPQSDWDIGKWAIELERQAKRINWTTYTWKEACTDAILFQMTSKTWRDKALQQQWSFHDIVAWGKKNVITSKHGKRLDNNSKQAKPRDDDADHPIDRLADERGTAPRGGSRGRGRGCGSGG